MLNCSLLLHSYRAVCISCRDTIYLLLQCLRKRVVIINTALEGVIFSVTHRRALFPHLWFSTSPGSVFLKTLRGSSLGFVDLANSRAFVPTALCLALAFDAIPKSVSQAPSSARLEKTESNSRFLYLQQRWSRQYEPKHQEISYSELVLFYRSPHFSYHLPNCLSEVLLLAGNCCSGVWTCRCDAPIDDSLRVFVV